MINNKNFSTLLFSLSIFIVLAVGWHQREEYWLSAEKGWGYALGIIGGSLMLVLLLYPLRKHWKLARNWFSIRHWFKMHMLLGVLGPVLILFHSNFQLGSLNSNIALFSMLLVSGSGVIGRYAYQKIHRGLYGEQIEFSELKKAFDQSKQHYQESDLLDEETRKQLARIEARITQRTVPLTTAFSSLHQCSVILKFMRETNRDRAKQLLNDKMQLNRFIEQANHLQQGIVRLKKMANYALFARIFSMWHVFHLPIFFMMIIAGVVHVFAVHIY